MNPSTIIFILIIFWALFIFVFDRLNKKQMKKIAQDYNPNDDKGRKGTEESPGASETTTDPEPIPPRPPQPKDSGVLQTAEADVPGKDSKGSGRVAKFTSRFRRAKAKK